jgi:hypothetical protein
MSATAHSTMLANKQKMLREIIFKISLLSDRPSQSLLLADNVSKRGFRF